MAYQFAQGQIFAPVLPMTGRKTLAYILARNGDELVVAECGRIHNNVRIQVNMAFGNEFAKVIGRDDDFTISAPCALSKSDLSEAQKDIVANSRILARGE